MAILLMVSMMRVASMIIELLLPSFITGLLIALAAGVLGCFVIWRRMAFFSDALAHSALLGTALALIAEVDLLYGLLGYGAIVAFIMARYDSTLSYSGDTLLAIISQISLALGLLLIPFANTSINIEALLFGDILAINWNDVFITFIIALAILLVIGFCYHPLLDLCIDEELAATEGVNVSRYKLLLFLLLVALIAVAVQVVGVLLISALLLIPAASARRLAINPLQMLIFAPLFGIASVALGLFSAYQINSAAGPTIVIATAALWAVTLAKNSKS